MCAPPNIAFWFGTTGNLSGAGSHRQGRPPILDQGKTPETDPLQSKLQVPNFPNPPSAHFCHFRNSPPPPQDDNGVLSGGVLCFCCSFLSSFSCFACFACFACFGFLYWG